MAEFIALPGVTNSWWLVVARKDGLTPLCTVNLGLLSTKLRGECGIDEIKRRASETFSPHLGEEEGLLVFMFNRLDGEYLPRAGWTTADPRTEMKFVDGFPWVNVGEELPGTEDFLLGIGLEPHHVNRKLFGMAARKTIAQPIPIPTFGYGCGT